MSRSNVISEVSAPRRANPAWQPKAIVFHLIQSRAGHDAAHLRLLAKSQQVRHHTGVLAAPTLPSDSHARLDFIEYQERFVLIANPAEQL